MRMVQPWIHAALAFALGACATEEADVFTDTEAASHTVALSGEVKPTTDYYTVRRDLRRCAFPFCSGYFVASVNQPHTTCADGTRSAECYVAEIDLPEGISLEDGDLVQGKFVPRTYPSATLSTLEAALALSPVLSPSGKGYHFLAFDTGIRCITTPCPSIAITALNTSVTFRGPQMLFAGKQGAALEEAFYNELGSDADTGSGAVTVGSLRYRFDWRTYAWTRVLDVQNVYVAKAAPSPACLVHTQEQQVTAWNFASSDEAKALAATLPADVQILDTRCADALTICPFVYLPVHGTIDALDESCVEQSNACGFRAAVIHAAGTDSKAQGSFKSGVCAAETPCEVAEDCDRGFCGWNEENARVCKPWAELGEHCEGFVLPWARKFCAPELQCVFHEATGDAGGTCQPR